MYLLNHELDNDVAILKDCDMIFAECNLILESASILADKLYSESAMTAIVDFIKKIWNWVSKVWKLISPIIDKLFGTNFSGSGSSSGGGGGIAAAPTHSNELVANPMYCSNSAGSQTNIGTVINVNINLLADTQLGIKPIGGLSTKIQEMISSGKSSYEIAAELQKSLKETLDNLHIKPAPIEEHNGILRALSVLKKGEHGYDVYSAYNDFTKYFAKLMTAMIQKQFESSSFIERDIDEFQALLNEAQRPLVMIQSAIPYLRDTKITNLILSQLTAGSHVKVPIFKASKSLFESIKAYEALQPLIQEYINAVKNNEDKRIAECKEIVNRHIQDNMASDRSINISDLHLTSSDGKTVNHVDFVINKIFTEESEISHLQLQTALILSAIYPGTGYKPGSKDIGKPDNFVDIHKLRNVGIFDNMVVRLWKDFGTSGKPQNTKAFRDMLDKGEPSYNTGKLTEADILKYKDLAAMMQLNKTLFDIFFRVHRNIFKCACIEYLTSYIVYVEHMATEAINKHGSI